MKKKFDFSGYATKANIRCSDGRVILKDAFKHNDGQTVPLVWQHLHSSPDNILGHAILENREDGVYSYCVFNDTESGKQAKTLVQHGDITSLSIHANQLKQKGTDVLHGMIREVSLVLAGANPGAFIDNLAFEHGDGGIDESEAIIFTDEEIELNHEESEETIGDVFDTLTEKQKNVVNAMIDKVKDDADDKDDDDDDADADAELSQSDEETVGEIFDTLTDKQKNVVYAMIAQAMQEGELEQSDEDEEDETINHSKGGKEMKTNVFDAGKEGLGKKNTTLSHADMVSIFAEAKRCGSLKDAVLEHAGTYGIDNINYLFPDAKNVNNTPTFIKRDMEWVDSVMKGTRHSPFARIKSLAADITADDARAKGYITGAEKKEEVFALLKRETYPTTVYKKQKLDRDDLIDITDMDVVSWLKSEMRMMLDEEIARAVLIGDGRETYDSDKISETNIRPIYKDDAIYAPHIKIAANKDTEDIMDAIIRARKQYKGSGNPTLYASTDFIIDALLIRDSMGRRLYTNEADLAATLKVSKIVDVPLMEGVERTVDSDVLQLKAIMVNLTDYVMGANKGGEINMFDNFDIDYNQYKYLMETRCSGALVQPKSAIVVEQIKAAG